MAVSLLLLSSLGILCDTNIELLGYGHPDMGKSDKLHDRQNNIYPINQLQVM